MGMSFDVFEADRRTVDATERRLSRLSEMVVRIGPDRFAVLAPDVPFHMVKGLGNALRHEYDRIDLQKIYDTVPTSLPLLRAAMVARSIEG